MPASAQYTWTNANNLVPYTQNFNSLSGAASFTDNTTLPGVYAQAEFTSGFKFTPTTFAANDGSTIDANYYHFGEATGSNVSDRSFGGIASTTLNGTLGDGTGHVGIRLKNGTTTTIHNLEIVYAMEHWYNSGQKDKAKVDVSYLKTAANVPISSLLNSAGAWVSNADLSVDAPSTATVVASRDGNSPTNRRVRQTTLSNIELAPNQEIMIRWSYVLNTQTNGNGLSIDDVTISAFTNIFYSKVSGNLNNDNVWSSTVNGTGALPSNFSFALPNATYYVQGNTTDNSASASRINGSAAWTVNGSNSKIVIGLPGATTDTRLYIDNNDDIVGRIDVEARAAIAIQQPSYSFTLGELDPTSTVEYLTTSTALNIAPVAYGNLKVTGGGNKILTGNTLVNGNLVFATASNAAPDLLLGDYNLTLQRGGQIQGTSNTAFVVTNGKGVLKQTVANTGADVVFPIGSSATSYTPISLRQPSSTTARNEDVFAVRVLDKMYTNYDAKENGVVEVLNQNVKKTWFVAEEVAGNADVTMTLQGNPAEQMSGGAAGTTFDPTKAYITHYINTGAKPYFDKVAAAAATTGTVAGSYKLTRAGLNSFSPYAVSSNAAAPLPVELVAFGAAWNGEAVQCSWKTASERNNSHYVVERSSDGQKFEAIGTVAGSGNTSTSRSYTFLDAKPLADAAYYRLQQIDLDGTTTYSPVVIVNGRRETASARFALAVVPNPSADDIRVVDPSGTAIPLHGTLYTLLGSVQLRLQGQTALDLRSQPAGSYVLRLVTAQGPIALRVVKN